MTFPVEFSAEAEEELDVAVVWFDELRSGLGSEFLEAVEEVARNDGLLLCPEGGAVVAGWRLRQGYTRHGHSGTAEAPSVSTGR